MKIVMVVIVLFCAVSCQTGKSPEKAKTPMADTAKFYPLAGFFRKQMEYVDLRNFLIYRVTIKDGKKDSSALSKEQFLAWAQVFLNRSISAPAVKALYKETVFHDLSTHSYTLNYSPAGHSAEVQNIDILLDEDNNFVKRVFIRAAYNRGDTAIDEQCSWKADKSFQVNRFLQTKNGYTSTELNLINWNDKP
jgi:hypothetical protein